MNKLVLCVLSALVGACEFHARSPEEYRDATQAVLLTKNAEIKSCYDAILKSTPGVGGKVTIRFKVEKESGRLLDVSADPARTTAPEPVVGCVVQALNNLTLTPPDARDGQATFEYEFGVVAPPAPAPVPATAG